MFFDKPRLYLQIHFFKKTQMKKIILFSALIFIAAAPTFAQNNGAIHLSKGQKYVVENKITTNSSSEVQGQQMESNADITTVFNINVDDVKDNNYNMTNSIAGIKMNMTMAGQNVTFDSDKKEDMDGQMGTNIKGYINKPNPVTMDASGKIIIDDKKDSLKDSASTQTAMLLKQLGDPEAQGYGATFAFVAIPQNAKAGTTWQDSTSKDGVTRVTNYTIKEIKDNIATLSISGTETRDTKMQMNGMDINTKTNGKFTGEETVDKNTGVILQNNSTMDASGNVSAMGQDFPTTVKATLQTTVKPM